MHNEDVGLLLGSNVIPILGKFLPLRGINLRLLCAYHPKSRLESRLESTRDKVFD